MSVIADFSVAAEQFVLSRTLKEFPDTRVEVERVVAHSEESVTPYFRVSTDDFESFEAAIEDDPSIDDLLTLEETDGQRFYRAEWLVDIEGFIYVLDAGQTAIMEAVGENGSWRLRMLFPDREKLSDFDSHCQSQALSYELIRTFSPDNPNTFGRYEVTDDQRDALIAAFEDGYFEVPRGTTTEEIAERLDVSAQAVSVRLRRGLTNLLGNTLLSKD